MIRLDHYHEDVKKAGIDFTKMPDYVQEVHRDFDDYYEFYNEDPDITTMLQNHVAYLSNLAMDKRTAEKKAKKTLKEKKQNPPKHNFKYEKKGNEIVIKNLKDYYTSDEIEKKFIKKGVQWAIFSDDYIFDLDNADQLQLLKKELKLDLKPEEKPQVKAKKKGRPKAKKKTTAKTTSTKQKPCNTDKLVEAFTEDVRLIRRFNNAIGKERQRRSILNIYRDFERRAIERKIKAESPYADVIREIQKRLKKAIDNIDKNGFTHVTLKPNENNNFFKKVADIAKSTGLRTSATLLKRFVGIEGEIKPDTVKVERILNAFNNAINKGKICEVDLYWKEIQEAKREMERYLKSETDKISLSPQSLNGLGGLGLGKHNAVAVKNNGNGSLSGITTEPAQIIRYEVDITPINTLPEPVNTEPVIFSSPKNEETNKKDTISAEVLDGNNKNIVVPELFSRITDDLTDTDIKKITLPGDLGRFLGYVERYEYSILLRGEKGAGKTRLLYQLMNTFALAGFRVASFSLEIGKSSNIVRDMRNTYIHPTIAHNIFIADQTPNGLKDIETAAKQFDVVCIDSWGKIGNTKPDDFDKLRKKYPNTMFVVIFQSTTNGTARGGSMPEYDAGIVIQVANGGRAYCEKNRYNGEDLTYLVFEQKLE